MFTSLFSLPPLPVRDLTEVRTVKELDTHINQVLDYVKQEKNPHIVEDCITNVLISLGRAFIQKDFMTSLTAVLGDLKNHLSHCERIIININALANKMCSVRDGSNSVENLAFPISLQYALIAGWHISLAIEESMEIEKESGRLRHYKPYLNRFWSRVSYTHNREESDSIGIHPLLNAQLEKDLQLLIDFEKDQESNECKTVFRYLYNPRPSGYFGLKEGMGMYCADFNYVKERAKNYSDWKTADAWYTEFCRSMPKQPDVDIEEWRIHWFHANGLPIYFKCLRQLAYRAGAIKLKNRSILPFNDPSNFMPLYFSEGREMRKYNKQEIFPVFHFTHENGERIPDQIAYGDPTFL